MFEQGLEALWHSMGIANLGWGQLLMILVGGLLIFLASGNACSGSILTTLCYSDSVFCTGAVQQDGTRWWDCSPNTVLASSYKDAAGENTYIDGLAPGG